MSNFIRRIASQKMPSVVKKRMRAILRQYTKAPSGSEKGADFYDEAFLHTEQYNVHYTKSNYYYLWCVLVDRVIRSGSKLVLDIGCGPGQVANFLQDRGLPDYFGLDLSTVATEKASKLCPKYQFRAENALETDVLTELSYDTVISLEFLEHVQEELSVLEKIRSGTRFIGTVPDFPYVSHVRHFCSSQEVSDRYGHLFHSFTVDEFKDPSGRKRYFLLDGIRK